MYICSIQVQLEEEDRTVNKSCRLPVMSKTRLYASLPCLVSSAYYSFHSLNKSQTRSFRTSYSSISLISYDLANLLDLANKQLVSTARVHI